MEGPRILNQVNNELKEKFWNSFSITLFVGAGISVSSGIPTFRGAGKEKHFRGEHNPMYLLSREGFSQYPKIAWEYIKHTYEIVKNANPNAGHNSLVELQKKVIQRKVQKMYLLTTNYDGLINKAGGQAEELYGNINSAICYSCREKKLIDQINLDVLPPVCSCGEILIPDIVMIGSLIKESHYNLCLSATRGCSIYIAIGTSGANSHSYGFMKSVKLRQNVTLVEINPRPSHLSKDMDYTICANAEEILMNF